MVLGEMWMPSFRASSDATRRCPQVRFSRTMSAMSARRFPGIRGLPPRDFQRQKSCSGASQPASLASPRQERASKRSTWKEGEE